MSNNRRKIEKCLAGGENHVTVHTGVNSNNKRTLNIERSILMKSEKTTQILLLAAGLVFFLVGIFRGEAAVVLSKAIKLCMECVGIG